MTRARLQSLASLIGTALVVVGLGAATFRAYRRARPGRSMIAVIDRGDWQGALAALSQGADPNARRTSRNTPIVWQALLVPFLGWRDGPEFEPSARSI